MNIGDNRQLYNINGELKSNFLDISSDGKLLLKIDDKKINLYDLMIKHKLTGAYVRVLPLIRKTMDHVIKVFNNVFRKYGYNGKLYPVYPLKVNTRDIVVDTIYKHGSRYNWGFNLNTYPEIKVIEKYLNDEPRMIVFDGLLSRGILEGLKKFYKKDWFVVVDISSLRDAELMDKYNEFSIGLRIKYLTRGKGPWKESSGLDSKFGLTITVLNNIIDRYDWIYERAILLHMHPGSQIHDLGLFKKYFIEASNMFNELRNKGFNRLEYIDLGGGLAYPYYEAKFGSIESPNYRLEEYVENMVKVFSEKLAKHPNIVFENGRYIVASHRIVVSKVIEVRPYRSNTIELTKECRFEELDKITDIEELTSYIEEYERKMNIEREHAMNDLDSRKKFEEKIACFDKYINIKIYELIGKDREALINALNNRVLKNYLITPSHRFYIASSIFTHIPDKLVVNQYFQVVPLQRLNEKPEVLGVLSDLTCDSMGEYGDFISYIGREGEIMFSRHDKKLIGIPGKKIRLKGIPLHLPDKDEEYFIALLDTGAYQDMLAMKHNSLEGYDEVLIDIIDGELKITVKHLEEKPYDY
ncbi:MAG: arginine decarboxylase [Desulfurococcales archaeon ex4484_58]|nr:MAG: arginine decarboxylase [Desulfurococcales archaeon ex4484_58]